MSATPRPWYLAAAPDYPDAELFVVGNPDWNGSVEDGPIVCSAGTADGHEQWERQNLELIVTAVNTFDALLAVAKAANELRADREDETETAEDLEVCRLCAGWRYLGSSDDPHLTGCPLAVLDAAHPDWRTWT